MGLGITLHPSFPPFPLLKFFKILDKIALHLFSMTYDELRRERGFYLPSFLLFFTRFYWEKKMEFTSWT